METRFKKATINTASDVYKRDYINKVVVAIGKYLNWRMNHEPSLSHLTRFFKHVYHGRAGLKRVNDLKKFLDKPEKKFAEQVMEIANTVAVSGYNAHSFRRYLFESLTSQKLSTYSKTQIENTLHFRVRSDLNKVTVNGQQSLTIDMFSPWCLTTLAYNIQFLAEDKLPLFERTALLNFFLQKNPAAPVNDKESTSRITTSRGG